MNVVKIPVSGQPGYTKQQEIEKKRMVLIGANGSGKTRLAMAIKNLNDGSIFIPAQRSLIIPTNYQLKALSSAEADLKTGQILRSDSGRYNQQIYDPATNIQFDYEQLLVYLFAEEAATSTKYRRTQMVTPGGAIPPTRLDMIKSIWESIISHKKLTFEDLKIDVSGYPASAMSDGERLIFYIIGRVMAADRNQVIIIDEPENHLHKAVVKSLYDALENDRPDLTFIYLTHDIDFAFTRVDAARIWLQEYKSGDTWNFTILDETAPVPEQLYLEILGSRKPVLFIEGDDSSIDYLVYELIFAEYTVKPLGSCEKVIHTVKSFNDQYSFHRIKSYGIIDRDSRTEEEIKKLNSQDIWILDTAEIENMLLAGDIIYEMAASMFHDEPYKILNTVKDNIIGLFDKVLDAQIRLRFDAELKRLMEKALLHDKKSFAEIDMEIDKHIAAINKKDLWQNIEQEYVDLIKNKDYAGVLKGFNFKEAIYANAKVCELIGITTKPSPLQAYTNRILALLKQKDERSKRMERCIKSLIIK